MLNCCEEMKRACKEDQFEGFIENGELVFSDDYDLRIKINYCPACGSVITFTPPSNTKPEDTSESN